MDFADIGELLSQLLIGHQLRVVSQRSPEPLERREGRSQIGINGLLDGRSTFHCSFVWVWQGHNTSLY